MKILVDENIPFPTVQALREMSYDVLDIRGTLDEGLKDKPLWELCQRVRDYAQSTWRRREQE